MHSFVALDLELTPSSGDQQRIIEIAATRFRNGALEDTFSSLVNPGCDLDPHVEALTGISQADLSSAPRLGSVIPRFRSFICDDLLIGQSIHLDLECLSREGVDLDNPTHDTFELASLLLPGLPSYDLVTIGKKLGVQPERAHRALEDALVTGRVFLALRERAQHLSLELLTQISALTGHLRNWALSPLFNDLLQERLRSYFTAPPPTGVRSGGEGGSTDLLEPTLASGPAVIPAQHVEPNPAIDPSEMASLIGAEGSLASALPGFEVRPEQAKMMEAVADAFDTSRHLLVEAGTGTGKSIAYLLPSVYYAARHGRHVVVSTNTLNLQDQLYSKDIPVLQQSVPFKFKAALLKGRANYLCLRRWTVLSRSQNLTESEVLLLIKTLIWLAGTESGDKAELNLTPAETALWPRISAQAESCTLARCSQFRRGNCFVLKARKNAESAHVVVVNHALLLSDLATSGGVLPEYSHLVVDEAHHLEEEATDQLAFSFGWSDLSSFLSSLHQVGPGQRPVGFLPELAGVTYARALPPESAEAIRAFATSASEYVDACLMEGKSFFEIVGCFLHDHAEDRYRSGARLRVTGSVRTQPGWSEVEVRWSELTGGLRSLDRALRQLDAELQQLEEGQLAERDGLVAEISGFRSYLERLDDRVLEIVSEPDENGVYWISGGSTLDELELCSAPLHVGEALNAALFSCKDSVVLTSATLTAEGCFDYIRERLSLDDASELVLGSPFDYRRSALMYVVQDMPEPARPAYQRAVDSAITSLVTALEGRTLVLFTSHGQLRVTNSAVRSRLEEAGILVLAHGIDGSRRRLLQAFRSTKRAVLFGTSSFWEGIDVVGDALSCVVIVKLPFAVPTDPIFAARSESFDEPFRQYSVPQTILKFKQGFGRLIRSASDRGAVVILDSRLRTKFYGSSFIQSVPRCTVRIGTGGQMVEAVRDWVDGGVLSAEC